MMCQKTNNHCDDVDMMEKMISFPSKKRRNNKDLVSSSIQENLNTYEKLLKKLLKDNEYYSIRSIINTSSSEEEEDCYIVGKKLILSSIKQILQKGSKEGYLNYINNNKDTIRKGYLTSTMFDGLSHWAKPFLPKTDCKSSYKPDHEQNRKYPNIFLSNSHLNMGLPNSLTLLKCDICNELGRLREIVGKKKLLKKWYCGMDLSDPGRARCSASEVDYKFNHNSSDTLSGIRTRKHLRLWVKRLRSNASFQVRYPQMLFSTKYGRDNISNQPFSWIKCCNPSCGKWRSMLRDLDVKKFIESCTNGEWYCVLNTWNDKVASCAAPQEDCHY